MDPHFLEQIAIVGVRIRRMFFFLFFLLHGKPNKQIRSLHLQAFLNPSVETVLEKPIHIWSWGVFRKKLGTNVKTSMKSFLCYDLSARSQRIIEKGD